MGRLVPLLLLGGIFGAAGLRPRRPDLVESSEEQDFFEAVFNGKGGGERRDAFQKSSRLSVSAAAEDGQFLAEIAGLGVARGYKSAWADTVVFRTLPYALPPEGDRVLMPAEEYPVWTEEKGRSVFPPLCPQVSWTSSKREGSNDCLYLNIFVPYSEENGFRDNLPVMVFIHGGAFQSGDSYYGGGYDASGLAAQQNVIVVTTNYRLGPEGFLAHPSMLEVGSHYNLGLLDQRLAMKWVSQNIAAFGGHPKRVTLFGESAGAMSICFHLTSPLSYPFYQAVIMQSPGCGGSMSWLSKQRAEAYGKALADELNCTQAPSVLACLRERLPEFSGLEWGTWIEATKHYGLAPEAPVVMVPVVDGTETGLTGMPNDLIEEGLFNKVPMIVGTNRDEGSLFKLINPVPGKGRQSFADLAYHYVGPRLIKEIPDVYNREDPGDNTGDFLGDALFVCPTYSFYNAVARNGGTVYVYRFIEKLSKTSITLQALKTVGSWIINDEKKYGRSFGLFMGWLGSPHAMDLMYVFTANVNPDNQMIVTGNKEDRITRYFTNYWGQFARTFSPNGAKVPEPSNSTTSVPLTQWPRFNPDNPHWTVMRIGDPPSAEVKKRDVEWAIQARCEWWKKRRDAINAPSKPWQTEYVLDYGNRCCCDTSRDGAICKRIPAEAQVVSGSDSGNKTAKTKWNGKCPVVDLGRGPVQTHHDPLGCFGFESHRALRCCCAEHDRKVCQRLGDDFLKRRARCPKVCGMDATSSTPFKICAEYEEGTIQTKHDPDGCV